MTARNGKQPAEPLHQMKNHEQRINEALGKVFRNGAFEVVDHGRSPLDELRFGATPGDEEEADSLVAFQRREDFRQMLEYIYADGPHPGYAMRRLYALAYALRPQLIGNMSQQDLANLFGETKAAQSWRIEKIFSGYLKSKGFRGFKAPGQKTEESRAVYRQVQKEIPTGRS